MRPRAAAATWLPPARPRAMRAMLRPGAAAAAQQGSKRFARATKWQPCRMSLFADECGGRSCLSYMCPHVLSVGRCPCSSPRLAAQWRR